jgi:hypothetical protein
MSAPNDKIRLAVNEFVNVLSGLVREAAMVEVTEAIKNATGYASAPRAVVGRKPSAPARAPIAASNDGKQRTPELLAQLMGRVHSTIVATPGQSVGTIAASLGTSSKALSLALRKLLNDKKVVSKGKKRGTRYFPR